MTVEDYVEDQEIKLQNKEEQFEPAYGKHFQRKVTKSRALRNRLKRTKTVPARGRTDGQRATIGRAVLKNCGSKKRLSETALLSYAKISTRELNARKKT